MILSETIYADIDYGRQRPHAEPAAYHAMTCAMT